MRPPMLNPADAGADATFTVGNEDMCWVNHARPASADPAFVGVYAQILQVSADRSTVRVRFSDTFSVRGKGTAGSANREFTIPVENVMSIPRFTYMTVHHPLARPWLAANNTAAVRAQVQADAANRGIVNPVLVLQLFGPQGSMVFRWYADLCPARFNPDVFNVGEANYEDYWAARLLAEPDVAPMTNDEFADGLMHGWVPPEHLTLVAASDGLVHSQAA